jgi:hypothetical protein
MQQDTAAALGAPAPAGKRKRVGPRVGGLQARVGDDEADLDTFRLHKRQIMEVGGLQRFGGP